MPLPHRPLRLRLFCLAVAACLAASQAGCNFFQLLPVRNDKADPLKGDMPRIEQAGAKVAVEPNPANLPVKCQYRLSQYLFLADFELQRDLPLFKELAELREQVHKTLQLPPSTRLIQVCLFEDKERYERFMVAKYPYLPKRRAFFVAEPRPIGGEELMVYTFWGNGERIEQDLRHELTHALLHSVLKDVPLWLDEGLAEYFEIAPGLAAINAEHMKQLRHGPNGPVRVDLARLEKLQEVEQMTPGEYREAWAWVHLMLHTNEDAKKVLINYVRELRTTKDPGRCVNGLSLSSRPRNRPSNAI